MQKRKAISAIIILVMLWLPINGLVINSIAGTRPISKKGIEEIGLNKLRLESGIGVLTFDLTEFSNQNRMTGDGFLTISNTYDSNVFLKCSIIVKKLSPPDLDEDGKPRIHPKVSYNITFYPVPTKDWITLENTTATIPPFHVYDFYYHVDIPLTSEWASYNNSNGYLLYINVKKTIENATGANVGIDYSYKLFIIFYGKYAPNTSLLNTLILIIIPATAIGVTIVVVYKKRHKCSDDTDIDTLQPNNLQMEQKNNVKVEDRPIFIIGGDKKNNNSGGSNK